MSRILKSLLLIGAASAGLLYVLGWNPARGATALPDPKVDESPAAVGGEGAGFEGEFIEGDAGAVEADFFGRASEVDEAVAEGEGAGEDERDGI